MLSGASGLSGACSGASKVATRLRLGIRRFIRDPVEIDCRDQIAVEGRFDLGRQVERVDFGRDSHEKEGNGCQQTMAHALGFAKLLAAALGQVRRVSQLGQFTTWKVVGYPEDIL